MGHIGDIYTNAVYANLKPLRANWSPQRPLELGDYGTMDGQNFIRLGNVKSLGMSVGNSISDDRGDQLIFSSGKNTKLAFTAKGAIPAGGGTAAISANLSISFSSDDAAFFNASGCTYSMIEDKTALGAQVMKANDDHKWDRAWAVVTDLVKAKSTTVVVSGSDNANIVLAAQGNIPEVNLADASIGLTVQSATNVGYQLIAKDGLTALLGLSKVQSVFLGMLPKFKPLSADMLGNRNIARAMQDSDQIETEPRKYLLFVQLA